MSAIAAVVIGVLAALAYAARRRWIDAVLALVAGVAARSANFPCRARRGPR